MVIVPKDDRIDPNRLYGWIRDQNITVFESTPALILPFMQHIYEEGLDLSSMKLLITSSDACSVTDYRLLQRKIRADNSASSTATALPKRPLTAVFTMSRWTSCHRWVMCRSAKPG